MLAEEVTEEDVAQVVAKWTGIPVSRLMEGEVEKLIQMEERLHERVIGQDEAIEAVSNALRRSRAGLSDPDRPIGSFLFLGPTGVGKTELAKALAEFMFDSEQAIVRLDMSEYMEKHTVARLIGAPPGYVGYEEGGQLTEAVRRRPYAVVLLDEIEKAHPDVFNTLLQIMDDGRLTDGQGRTVSFTNTVLIMTSNVGSDRIVGESVDEKIREQIEEVLAATFKPEFLNRIDDTVIFHRLSKEDIGRIVELQVDQLVGRVRERGIEVELTDDARTLLGNLGYDPTYGARPLKRVIQKQLVDKLALKILEGEFAEGDEVAGRRGGRRAGLLARRRRASPPNRLLSSLVTSGPQDPLIFRPGRYSGPGRIGRPGSEIRSQSQNRRNLVGLNRCRDDVRRNRDIRRRERRAAFARAGRRRPWAFERVVWAIERPTSSGRCSRARSGRTSSSAGRRPAPPRLAGVIGAAGAGVAAPACSSPTPRAAEPTGRLAGSRATGPDRPAREARRGAGRPGRCTARPPSFGGEQGGGAGKARGRRTQRRRPQIAAETRPTSRRDARRSAAPADGELRR